jgi:hypothetical protein
MRLTRENLVTIARETVEKRIHSSTPLVAAYLTGSILTENPFLGNATDIDLVFVHAREPKVRREIIALTPAVHLDIRHNTRAEYDKPRELRLHPWMGPEMYDPMPLYITQHFFEFVQAGVRDRFHDPANVLARSNRLAVGSRQVWSQIKTSQATGPELLIFFLSAVQLAANAVALLAGGPLAERRLMLMLPKRAEEAGAPDLASSLEGLLGAHRTDKAGLGALLPEWERAFLEAARRPHVEARISSARLGYYKLAFESLLESETPQAIIWPLINTWTLAAAILPAAWKEPWQSACALLGLDQESLAARMQDLDHYLDSVEELLEKRLASQAL